MMPAARPETTDNLLDLAMAATPGPYRRTISHEGTPSLDETLAWMREYLSHGETFVVRGVMSTSHPLTVLGDDPDRPEHGVLVAVTGNGPNSAANSAFFAACTPEAIVQLVQAAKTEPETAVIQAALAYARAEQACHVAHLKGRAGQCPEFDPEASYDHLKHLRNALLSAARALLQAGGQP